MTLDASLQRLSDLAAANAANAGSLDAHDLTVNGTQGEPDGTVARVISNEGFQTALAFFGLKGAQILVGRYLDSQITTLQAQVQPTVTALRREVQLVERTADSAGDIALIGGVLPTVGPIISRLQLRNLLSGIENGADSLDSGADVVATSLQSSISFFQTLKTANAYFGYTLLVAGPVLAAYKAAASETTGGGNAAAESAAEATETVGPLAEDARVAAGFGALSLRFDMATSDIRAASDAADGLVDPVFDAYERSVMPVVDAAGETVDAVEALLAPANALDGIGAATDVFVSALGTLTRPFDAIFDFLADPPRVLGIRLFPAIPRSAINDIFDFLDAVTGAVSAALGVVLGPILTPITNAVNGLVSRLIDLDVFGDALAALSGFIDDVVEAIRGLSLPAFDFSELLAPFDALGEPSVEAFVAEEGAARRTFFGGDADDVVVGAAPEASAADAGAAENTPGALAEGDIPGVVFSGGAGDDDFTGSALQDLLMGGADDDRLTGLAGDDALFGGADDDVIDGGAGDDAIDGGRGFDRAVFAGARADYAIGTADGVLVVDGPDGRDDLVGIERLVFDDGEVDAGLFAPDEGGAEDDVISREGETDDDLSGGGGDDRIDAGAGDDVVRGGRGDDAVIGGAGADRLKGNGGADFLRGNAGRDRLIGGAGDDDLNGGRGADVVKGGSGDDRLVGGPGRDRLIGGGGDDEIIGGPGRDLLRGGAGDDLLTGGRGADRLIFKPGDGTDTVTDFGVGRDALDIRRLQDFADLDISQQGADAHVAFRDLTIVLLDHDAATLTEDDFLF